MAQTLYDSESNFTQSQVEAEHTSTEYFEISDFGFVRLVSKERYEETWYPTPDNKVEAGWFSIAPNNNTNHADLNGDGLTDLIINPVLFTHVASHPETLVQPILLIQDGNGGFLDPESTSIASDFPNLHMGYRLDVGDFDNDGLDDFAVAASLLIERRNDSYAEAVSELPYASFGSFDSIISSSQNFNGFQAVDYGYGHALTVGDFNGDGNDDFASNRTTFISEGNRSFVTDTFYSSYELNPENFTLSMTSGDYNNDGFDDLIYSPFHSDSPDGIDNGAYLYLLEGSASGLEPPSSSSSITNPNTYLNFDDNRLINFIRDIDVNGDGNRDFIFLEHMGATDSGDSSQYYTSGFLRLYLGDGKGSFQEATHLIQDDFAKTRQGEGNIHVLDVNGDGWEDVVLNGFPPSGQNWGDPQSGPSTSIFLNNKGTLNLVSEEVLAYLDSYQISGYEDLKEYQSAEIQRLAPVDLKNDGMVDFVGFVKTPLTKWPQVEPVYNYGYTVSAKKPLGRPETDENLTGTQNDDIIFGYDGNDILQGNTGNDVLNGGDGIDVARFNDVIDSYNIQSNGNQWLAIGLSETDELIDIERIEFTDKNLALDIEGSNSAGGIYRTYKAAFDRTPDTEGFGYWIDRSDNGASAVQMAEEFVGSLEFQQVYGVDFTDSYLTGNDINSVVDGFYNNVLGRTPDAAGLTFYSEQILNHSKTVGRVLAEIADSAENKANTAIETGSGMVYDLWLS